MAPIEHSGLALDCQTQFPALSRKVTPYTTNMDKRITKHKHNTDLLSQPRLMQASENEQYPFQCETKNQQSQPFGDSRSHALRATSARPLREQLSVSRPKGADAVGSTFIGRSVARAVTTSSGHHEEDKMSARRLSEEIAIKLHDVSQEQITAGVSMVLEHFVKQGAQRQAPALSEAAAAFEAPGGYAVPIHGLLDNLMHRGLCSKGCFIIALIYGERLLQKHPDFAISYSNVRRLMTVSVLVASKILDDFYCKNLYYAEAGDMTTAEVNALEVRFCFLLGFDLGVSLDEFALYINTLIREPIRESPDSYCMWTDRAFTLSGVEAWPEAHSQVPIAIPHVIGGLPRHHVHEPMPQVTAPPPCSRWPAEISSFSPLPLQQQQPVPVYAWTVSAHQLPMSAKSVGTKRDYAKRSLPPCGPKLPAAAAVPVPMLHPASCSEPWMYDPTCVGYPWLAAAASKHAYPWAV